MRIVFLPGLGADERLFSPQIAAVEAAGHQALTPGWPEHDSTDALAAFAQKLLAATSVDHETLLVGFSFGGMVALEMAAAAPVHERPAGVVLISGLRSKRAVTGAFKVQQAVGRLVPRGITRSLMTGRLVDRFARSEPLTSDQTETLRDMGAMTDLGFLFWAARACARWGFDGSVPVPVQHVHGRRDRTIPYVPHPDLPGGEAQLLDAGHLITWTAADQVNEILIAAAERSA